MNRKSICKAVVASAAVIALGGAAFAAVIFDPATGLGFVGKGDVQLTFGWNNNQLQNNADSVQFRVGSTQVTEVSWICTNDNNDNIQERARTTTTTTAGVLSTVLRERRQVTGFILAGYDGSFTETVSTDGPQLNSCPAGPWTLTTPAGEPQVVESSEAFEVKFSGSDWVPLADAD